MNGLTEHKPAQELGQGGGAPGPAESGGFWLDDAGHRAWLGREALSQFRFFRASPCPEAGFHVLDHGGLPLPGTVQELHTTTRLVHSYSLGQLAGVDGCEEMIDRGMAYLFSHHRDGLHGGYLWALDSSGIHDGRKLAYGHVFVLLAGASAKMAGHPDASRLIEDISTVLDTRFWEPEHRLFCDEWNRDWTPFSAYRGMNANMHGVEALLTAYEATGDTHYLERAGCILDFFFNRIAPQYQWRLPEHYDDNWQVDRGYSGDPMFRPPGTTPGHSFELARLLLQYWDLDGRRDQTMPGLARNLAHRALSDAWDTARGGFVYTLDFDGRPAITDRYWWPVTEAIGVLATLIKLERNPDDERWYRRLWQFADGHFIDHENGGWFPEIDDTGRPSENQFKGKPDLYHSIQACLFPLAPGISRMAQAGIDLKAALREEPR